MADIINKYKRLCKKNVKMNTDKENKYYDNPEVQHDEQDIIYRAFINDIYSKKLKTLKDIQIVANMLKKDVVKYDVEPNRWYA